MKIMRRAGIEAAKLAVVLWFVSVFAFLALRLTPGDPAVLLLGPQAGRPDAAETLARLRTEMGLDQPWPVQYGIWLGDILRGDFGVSSRSGVAVVELVAGAVPPTLFLILGAVLIAVPLSIIFGMAAAYFRNGIVDRAVRLVTTLAIAIPAVWLGLFLIIIFSVTLDILPSGGFTSPFDDFGEFFIQMILPVTTLAIFLGGVLTRFVYAEASDVLRQDYMRTALAMGISTPRRVFVYAMRNAVTPMITIVGVQIGALVGGAVLVEAVFGLGGIGQLLLSSVLNRDYQVVQGAVLLTTIVVLLVGYLADLAYRLVDPRITE
ncbi:peptide/nickel transport system permease protein [Salinibacterium amurskyense]|uniref:Peptide/nickel transport system permease protein n=2 Tax=Microbacteriaceae TaxID=85023 RepID=A0A2M9DA48_9MICO|nr:ABC transporter permease [Salinibacterium sp. SWN248]PJJ82542.1 peptide/nickel transport system permease protein [Salinibacterium amurskyense]RLQ82282.1 ABC transporter permease [Salinibacterium amurskyense]GHD76572.1 peptide ABC transporter permease [Salinibacterium amurskyense]